MHVCDAEAVRLASPANEAETVHGPDRVGSGVSLAVHFPFASVWASTTDGGTPGWENVTSILEPDCAGMSVPATSIGFGLATLTGQESIVRVEATGPPVGVGMGEGTGDGGTGVGDGTGVGEGSSGTLRGASNDAAESVSDAGRAPPLRRARRKRAAAPVKSRRKLAISSE